MLGTPPVPNPITGFVRRLQEWPVASQQQARRNAMVASNACARRSTERRDVNDFLASRAATPVKTAQTTPGHVVHA